MISLLLNLRITIVVQQQFSTKTLYLLALLGVSFSCSPYKKNLPSKVFHNTTSHYNAYFIAEAKISEVENQIADAYQWNYNKILPIFPQFDTTSAKAYTSLTEDCIEKASIAIQRHPNSDWVQKSYILVGMARFYDVDFTDAIETFKYVNTHSEEKNERHQALVALMRTFIENNELKNAEAVSDYLKREKLNKENLKNLYLTRGYLYQKREDYDNMVANLVMAEPLLTRGNESARIYFLIGQVYQQIGFEAEAYNNYNTCLKKHPPYELEFYAKLNMAQVTELSNSSDLKKARKYFKNLLTDEKNKEYRDKIYYEMGSFELKQGNVKEAITFYENSVESSVGNERQKAYAYWRLSEIYYDNLKNFKLSKNYYDSTASSMPKDEIAYESIVDRQQILTEFVENLTIVETNDSLLHLASLDTATLNKVLDDLIQSQLAEKKAKEKRQIEKAARDLNTLQTNQAELIGAKKEGATWYFYNPSAVGQGNSEFLRKWGNRTLEDNWRRSSKGVVANANIPKSTPNPTGKKNDKEDNSTEELDPIAKRQAYIQTIPYSPESKIQLLAEVETALYNLGNIYYFKLDEKKASAETFEILLKRFNETEFAPEVRYQLYLSYKKLGLTSESNIHKNILLEKFPDTIYAKLILNPNYREESQAISSQLKKIYEKCYKQFQNGQYIPALTTLNETIKQYPDNEFTDNLDLLRILIIGKTNDLYKYQFELDNFVKSYSESELKPYAETLIKVSQEFQANQRNSGKANFIKDFDQKHYFILLYKPEKSISETLPSKFEIYIKKEHPELDLNVGNLILNTEYSMILISMLQTQASSLDFFTKFETDNFTLEDYPNTKFHSFVITMDNFNIFYQTKDFEAYKRFFRSNY
jgi:tetratricopeptide (TPR) repeat protein